METTDRQKHWENIYRTKNLNELSWFQPVPQTSLFFFKKLNVPFTANIIDVGGGDSFLVDHLLDSGYQNITVLDISEKSLDKAKQRLGNRSKYVHWIVADASTFEPTEKYDFWHDRATFHFLTREHEIEHYIDTVQQSIRPNGILVIGTFSERGPKTCSGITIHQYSESTMTDRFKKFFKKIECITVDHKTPSGTMQNFIFCSFKRL